MKISMLLSLLLLSSTVALAQTAPTTPAPMSAADQIASAILAAPEEMRDGAAVLGFGADGKLTELRKGTNQLV